MGLTWNTGFTVPLITAFGGVVSAAQGATLPAVTVFDRNDKNLSSPRAHTTPR